MGQATVIRSFAELADVLDGDEPHLLADPDDSERPLPDGAPEDMPDLDALLAELEGATATLATVAQRDEAIRARAMRDLERYDAMVTQLRQAGEISRHAAETRQRAEVLATRSFADEDREAANRVTEVAARIERRAEQLADQRKQESEQLSADAWLARALEERTRHQAEEHRRAAEAERARRLASTLAQARAALEAGQIEEATGLLGPLVTEHPNNPDVASLEQMIARYARNVKISAAEEALWAARRGTRRDPAAAVTRLETLDVDGLPEMLARHVFGEWAHACARLCRVRGLTDPLRYAPDPGRGAVIAREGTSGTLVVVSSLGMGPTWKPGCPVGDAVIRRARPLR